jgi:O-antigen/teichoic acid export membrane protein
MSYAMLSFIVNGVVGLVGAVITSRIYGVDIIGEYALVIAPWVMLIQLSSVAERVALIREIAGLPARDPRVTGLFVPVLAFSVLLTVVMSIPVLVITAVIYNGPADQPQLVLPAIWVVVAYILFDNTSANFDGIFSAFRSGRDLFIGRFIQLAGFPVFALLLLPLGKSVGTLTIATILAMVAAMLVKVVLVRAYLVIRATGPAIREGIRSLPDMLKFGAKVVPSQLIGGFADQASTWVLGAVAPISVVGAWSRSFALAQRMNEAGYRICEILYPTLMVRWKAGDFEGFNRALARTARLTAIGMLMLAAVVGGGADGVLRIFGEGFEEAAGAFAVLLFLFALACVAMVFGQGILAVGRPHQLTLVATIRSIAAFALMVPGAIYGEALGAALGLAGTSFIEVVFLAWMMRRYVGPSSLPSLGFVSVLTVAIAASFAVTRAIDLATPGIVGLVPALAAGAAIYGAITWLFALEADERDMIIGKARSILRRKQPA